jgi:hypothetical protein
MTRRSKIAPEQRTRLLRALRDGKDFAMACALADLDLDVVRSDHELMLACGHEHEVGTARLRAAMLERALADRDVHVLERALVGRETAQRQFPVGRKAEPDADGGFGERLAQLSDQELELVQWAVSGEGGFRGGRPERLLARGEWQIEWMAERAAAERARPKAPRLEDLGPVDDPATPIPRSRALGRSGA